MSIKMQVDFSEIYKTMSDAQKSKIWDNISSYIYAEVKKLMQQGKNVDGRKYKSYSASYKSWKVKNGYSGKVNLQLTSDMYRAISFRATRDGFEIYITGADNNKKAIKLNESKNWQFFQWGKKLEKKLTKVLDVMMKELGL